MYLLYIISYIVVTLVRN